jgi:mRNA-degrading endonuclease RelE of RelBE toxin-antitoxin system
MGYEIVVVQPFLKDLKQLSKRYPSIKKDVERLGASLSSDPFQGAALGKDLFKVRLAVRSKGKGKSGGARVITLVKVVKKTVYLLDIYDKSEEESLTNQQLDELRQWVPDP